ncbi:class I SAM-dependent methyltransferase [Paenibacillus harenae]|uniref:class I SAM-dependent methyltransferase n=1 Tax=Paenibacillus harenae TaxID=306543 RepID=UPI0003FAE20E|nr:SAM-dependent methyltransferase [Paenibacillus harenae]
MKDNALAAFISMRIAASPAAGWRFDAQGVKHTERCVSFREYMSDCLYHPEYGYYRTGVIRIGKAGDFYTSSGIGRILAEVLARYLNEFVQAAPEGWNPLQLIEWGAGTGRLSAQIAAAGSRLSGNWNERFLPVLIEDHPKHAAAARESFKSEALLPSPVIVSSEEAWSADWLGHPSIILANELFDAFPVHRIQRLNGELVELGVAGDVERGLYEVFMPLTEPRIGGWLERDGIRLIEGQKTEVHAEAADFLEKLAKRMTKGRLVLIDYGHEAAEYTAEHRMLGTLMCYWRHQASDSPYERIGRQDITSHVPFTFIQQTAAESGWRMVSYSSQKQFLMDNGVLEMLQNHNGSDPFGEAARTNRAVRQLLLSDQMSEAFKVMVLEKDNSL